MPMRTREDVRREKFEEWASKAPVLYTHQRVRNLYREHISERLTEDERHLVSVALDHAKAGEGRAEFDRAVADIRARLYPDR